MRKETKKVLDTAVKDWVRDLQIARFIAAVLT